MVTSRSSALRWCAMKEASPHQSCSKKCQVGLKTLSTPSGFIPLVLSFRAIIWGKFPQRRILSLSLSCAEIQYFFSFTMILVDNASREQTRLLYLMSEKEAQENRCYEKTEIFLKWFASMKIFIRQSKSYNYERLQISLWDFYPFSVQVSLPKTPQLVYMVFSLLELATMDLNFTFYNNRHFLILF